MKNDYVTLPERWSKFLESQPETGMDYQDGTRIRDVAIVGSSVIAEIKGVGVVRELPELPFDTHDIAEITVTHHKWKFGH